jgi:DNA-binding HxlR family transcriptional regulator
MGHPTMMFILQQPSRQSCCYSGDLSEVLPIAKSTLSQHLQELKDAGLIQGQIEAPKIKYCLNRKNWDEARLLMKHIFDLENRAVMKTNTLGFIGGGRITKIFLQAFKNKNTLFETTAVYDHNPETSRRLQKQFPGIELFGLEEISALNVVMIALHPPVILETLEKMQPAVTDETTIISLAPKITLEKISDKMGITSRIVRMIPNATSIINEGYNPVCFSLG